MAGTFWTLTFDTGIEKVIQGMDKKTLTDEITSSLYNCSESDGTYFKPILKDGYEIDSVTSGEDVGDGIYLYTFAGDMVFTSKQSGGGSMSKSVDLSTLTGWSSLSDSTHTITIKAKADGYRDSQASAGVQVTKGSSGYKVTITYSGLSSNLCFYSLDNGSTWVDGYVAGQTQLVLNNVEQIKFKVQADYSHYCAITRQSGDNFNSLYASSGGSETSSNITLTQDMVVQFAAGSD